MTINVLKDITADVTSFYFYLLFFTIKLHESIEYVSLNKTKNVVYSIPAAGSEDRVIPMQCNL